MMLQKFITLLTFFCTSFLYAQEDNPLVLHFNDENWDEITQSWQRRTKYAYRYDDQGREVYYGVSRWDAEESAWDVSHTRTIIYQPGYRVVKEVSGTSGERQAISSYRYKNDTLLVYSEHLTEGGPGGDDWWERHYFSYEPNGSFWDSLQIYNYDAKRWFDEGVASYVVEKDGRGCIKSETNTSYWRHQLQTLTESDDQCRPLRIFSQIWDLQRTVWLNRTLDSFFYISNETVHRQYQWDSDKLEWALYFLQRESLSAPKWIETHEWRENVEIRTRKEFDHLGNTIYSFSESRNLNDSVWQINFEVEQEWGAEGQLIRFIERSNFIDSLQEWSNYVDAVLRYNDHGDLENVQKLIREMIDQGNLIEYETVFDFGYDYYCDDSIRERRAFVNGNLYERDRYAYLYPADCVPDVSKELVFYPNPTTGFIYLESSLAEAGQSKLIVLNAMGQQVNNMNIRFWAGIVEVDLSQLPNGIYFIWVFEEEGKRKEVVKVLKVEGS
jgi:hypothetical protein